MSTDSKPIWHQPDWLLQVTREEEKAKASVRLHLSLACIYYSEKGWSKPLAQAVGMSANAFALMKTRGEVPPKIAKKLEQELGRKLFPRECFCPEVFED